MDLERLTALAQQRDGVMVLSDADVLGVSRPALAAYARRHGWQRPARGVLLLPGTVLDYRRAALVAVRTGGDHPLLVGGPSAAYLSGIIDRPPGELEVVAPFDRGTPAIAGLQVPIIERRRRITVTVQTRRSRTLRRTDAATVRGVPMTTPTRTLCDVAAVWTTDVLRSAVIDARQRRLIRLDDLGDCARRLRSTPGIGKVRRVLRDLDTHTCDSRLEWKFRMAAHSRGFRPWPRPFRFRCSDGVVIEIDVAFPEQWVAVECDGLGFHADRSALVMDHVRQNRAVADGWRPFRVDWTRLTNDADRLFAELGALLASVPPRDPARPASAE